MCKVYYNNKHFTHTNYGKIIASGKYKVAALTNNFEYPEDDLKEIEALGGKLPDELRSQFDEFIESRIVGLRYVVENKRL